jgi:hypothetical protein
MKTEKEVKMITGIFLVPVLDYHANKNANDTVKAIMYQLGALNCEDDDTCAVIRYNGILNKDAKEVLTDVAKQYGHRILYFEAEEDTSFADDDTFHIPTDDEMKEHLKWN